MPPREIFRMPTLLAELLPLIVEFAQLFSKSVWEHANERQRDSKIKAKDIWSPFFNVGSEQ